MADDEVGGGEVGLGVAVGNQVVMRPGLNLAGRRGGAEAGGAGRRHGGGAHQNHLIDRSLLDPGGEHIGGDDLIAGAGHQRRGLQHTLLTLGLDLLLAIGQARGLLAYFIESDIGVSGLHRGVGAVDGNDRGLGGLGIQAWAHAIFRIENDIAGFQHILDGGHVVFFAEDHAGLAVDLDGHISGALECTTGGRAGSCAVGGGE